LSQPWAVRLEKAELDSITKLRLAEGAEIYDAHDEVWVRGTSLSESLARLLRRHPHARRYWILPDDQLISPGKLVPSGYLPDGPWTPLCDWLSAELPTAQFARRNAGKLKLRLVRSSEAAEPNLLVSEIHTWLAHGSIAPQVRLSKWAFAAAADGRVVVRGMPLPSIQGGRFVETRGIAVPAGWTWSPQVSVEVLAEAFRLKDQDIALWQADGGCELICGTQFVRASRNAIRTTARKLADD